MSGISIGLLKTFPATESYHEVIRRIIHNYYFSVFFCPAQPPPPRSIERYPVPSINRLINVNEICKKKVFLVHIEVRI